MPRGIDPFSKVIPEVPFGECIFVWKDTPIGRTYFTGFEFYLDQENKKVKHMKQSIQTIDIKGLDGATYLDEIRNIEKAYGINETWSFDRAYHAFERFKVMPTETM